MMNATELSKKGKCEEEHTWGKHIGIPPRIAFGGLNVACTRLKTYSLEISLSSTSQQP